MKQRLIGAAVVTALAAIFIPMLFEDPVDNNGQTVGEMTIPEAPPTPQHGPGTKLPLDADSIDNANSTIEELTSGLRQTPSETQDAALDYEPPAETLGESDGGIGDDLDQDADTFPILDEDPAGFAGGSLPRTPVKPPVQTQAPQKPAAQPHAQLAQPAPGTPVTEPKTSAKLGRWYLQAGSYAKKENAISQWEALRKQGIPVMIEPQKTSKGTIYRLRVGPELSKQRALEMKNRLSQMKIKSILIAE